MTAVVLSAEVITCSRCEREDGSDATVGKRGAQVELIVGSLGPKAYQRESFAGRKAMSLNTERIETLRSFVETSMKKLDPYASALCLRMEPSAHLSGAFENICNFENKGLISPVFTEG